MTVLYYSLRVKIVPVYVCSHACLFAFVIGFARILAFYILCEKSMLIITAIYTILFLRPFFSSPFLHKESGGSLYILVKSKVIRLHNIKERPDYWIGSSITSLIFHNLLPVTISGKKSCFGRILLPVHQMAIIVYLVGLTLLLNI